MVHRLEAEYWGQVDFVYIDRENPDNQSVTQRFGIRGQPVFILLSPDGAEVERLFGYVSEEDLRSALDGILAAEG